MKQAFKNVAIITFTLFSVCIFAWLINHFKVTYYPEGRPDASPTIIAEGADEKEEDIFKHLKHEYVAGKSFDLYVDTVTGVEYIVIGSFYNSMESIAVTVRYNENTKAYRIHTDNLEE